MRTLENKIIKKDNEYPVQTIWFNAWKFDKEDSIRRALLMRVLQELKTNIENVEEKTENEIKLDQELSDLQTSLYHEVNREELGNLNFDWGKAAKGTFKLSLSLIPVIGSNITKLLEKGTNEEAIINILESIQREKKTVNIKKIQFMEEFHNNFQNIIRKYYKNKRVVIFIDDLDRSLPEKALEVLDAIKLFLDVEGCIFILGIDERVISYIINKKYKEIIGNADEKEKRDILLTGENYLEKIIQLRFQLPLIKDSDIKQFITSLEGMDPEFYGQFLELITQGIENNPRKIKRFFNIIELQRNIVEAMNLQKGLTEAELVIYNGLMMVWTIITLTHAEFRDSVKRNQLLLKPVLFQALDYLEFKEQPEEKEQVEYFLSDKSLTNLVTQFHDYINQYEDLIKSEEIPEMRINSIIEQVISLGSVTGGKIEPKELIKLQNQASSLINETEISLKELGNTFPEQKKIIEDIVENAREALRGEDPQKLKSLIKELEKELNIMLQAHAQQQEKEEPALKEKESQTIDFDEFRGELGEAIKNRESLAEKDLSGIESLKGMNLSFMNLERANLSGVNCENAKFTQAKLNGAILEGTIFIGAKLNNAKLWYANLKRAKLKNTNLRDAELYRADLTNANLQNADLYNAGLMSVYMGGACMKEANLRQVNLRGAVFDEKTDFRGATIDSITIDNLGGSNWEIAQWDSFVLEEIRKKYNN
ncbi:MAG: pentapeptide repeat-containing protein [Methanosarcinales archaeon]|nr:pentapeptide repeat-containing protein [Methanosarcinales archaeon]